MSEQRRVRSELKQGLHQFLMQLYMSYTETKGQDEAKKLVMEVLEEQYRYFSQNGIAESSMKEVLTNKIHELTVKMESVGDYDEQIYFSEKIDVLQAAMGILDSKF